MKWIEYQPGLEVELPEERAMIEEIVDIMGRINRQVFDKHRHALRDAHAKSHGILKGTLSVYPDLPAFLCQGIFQPGRGYPVVARLSSAPGDIHPDDVRSLKGLAVKVIGVDGVQVLPGKEKEVTQDFLLVNLPILPFGDVKAYLNFLRSRGETETQKDAPSTVVPALAAIASEAMTAIGHPARTLEAIGPSSHHILGETFHSMGAIRFGPYIGKLSVAPLSEAVRALAGAEIDAKGNDSAYRDLVVQFFQTESAEYEIRIQLCTDIDRMPIEDAAVEWPSDLSPHLPIGKITFPPQDAYSAPRRAFADEVLSFNPWHCIEAHRPLGSIMRSRIRAYEASSHFRHKMNSQPLVEPRDIGEIPD